MILNSIKKILKSKKAKRILFVFIFLFICYFAFSVGGDCLADGTVTDVQQKMTNFNEIASEIIKCIYVLLWPLIFVCGISLDNSLVYGDFLHLDAPLWSLWNVMKNIANFALGGIVLFSILRNLFLSVSKSPDNKWAPFKIIKNTLISGILIQMSRFLVAAVINLSSVLTYAVGGLPMTVLKSNSEYSNRPVMSLSINAGSSSKGMKYDIYYTYGDRRVSDCLVVDNLPLSGSYIFGPKIAYLWDSYNDTGFYMDTGYCTLGGWPYKYNHLLSGEDGGIYPDIYAITDTGVLKNQVYLQTAFIPTSGSALQPLIDNCVVIPVDDTKLPQSCKSGHYGALPFNGEDEFFRGANANNTILYTVDNLINESKGFVGPLITIYSSLLDVQSFVDIGSQSYVETFISLLFKLVFFVVLVAPLVGLAIVLVARIGILWVLIAASPVLILIWVFGDTLGKLKDVLGETFKLGNMIQLIFAPVIVTLAISISLIFVNAITMINRDPAQRQDVFDSLGIQTTNDEIKTYSILGLVDLKLNTTLIGKGKDDFAYFIALLFSTAIIRFFLIEALKLCGNIGKKVGKDWIAANVGNLLMTAPIVPLPNGGVGINSLISVPKAMYDNRILQPLREQSEKNMLENFPGLVSHGKNIDENRAKEIVEGELIRTIQNNPSITYGQLSREQVRAFNTYRNNPSEPWNDFDKFKKGLTEITAAGTTLQGSEHKSIDALQYTKDQLDLAVRSDDNWKAWASGMLGGAVHTLDGVCVVDVTPGTENNPQYEIVERDVYEKRHFGEPIQTVTKTEFTQWQTDDIKKYENMERYLENMKKRYDELDKLKEDSKKEGLDEGTLNEMKSQIAAIEGLFTKEFVSKLAELDPNNFKKPEEGGTKE